MAGACSYNYCRFFSPLKIEEPCVLKHNIGKKKCREKTSVKISDGDYSKKERAKKEFNSDGEDDDAILLVVGE